MSVALSWGGFTTNTTNNKKQNLTRPISTDNMLCFVVASPPHCVEFVRFLFCRFCEQQLPNYCGCPRQHDCHANVSTSMLLPPNARDAYIALAIWGTRPVNVLAMPWPTCYVRSNTLYSPRSLPHRRVYEHAVSTNCVRLCPISSGMLNRIGRAACHE